jgi:hypothetical protein
MSTATWRTPPGTEASTAPVSYVAHAVADNGSDENPSSTTGTASVHSPSVGGDPVELSSVGDPESTPVVVVSVEEAETPLVVESSSDVEGGVEVGIVLVGGGPEVDAVPTSAVPPPVSSPAGDTH